MTGYDSIEHASLTDVGIRRSHNQDHHAVLLAGDDEQWRKRGHVFLVADGMGAHAVGELASELAANIIPHTYQKHAEEGTAAALRKAFIEANTSIHSRGQQNRDFQGMGTTCTALLIRAEGAWVGHVGDSRAYRIRDGQVEQLSFDHSLAWEMAKRQKVRPEELQGIPSNVIVRSLGPEPLVKVDVEGPHPLRAGDIFLLCSDGLSGPLADEEIGAVASTLPPAEACQFLVDLTNLRGGPDNITVLIVRVGDLASPGEEAASRKPWRQRVNWSLIALVLSVLLAGGSAGLSIAHLPGRVPVFIVASVLLILGLVGMLVQYVKEKRHPPDQVTRPRRKIYRQASCRIEPPLLKRLTELEADLALQVREAHFEVDWATHQQHHQLAEGFQAREDLVGAFREHCRAMLVLTRTLQRLSHKGEVFKPNWEKKPPVKIVQRAPKDGEG